MYYGGAMLPNLGSLREYLKWHPRIELNWLRPINYFPPLPMDLEGIEEICIGTKTRTIGDALILTTLPGKLKARFPKLRIFTFPRGFNPIVFQGNPAIQGILRAPRALYGDDCNLGSGHHIQVKESFFNVPTSEPPRPQIFLSPQEQQWAQDYFKSNTKNSKAPLCIIHPWGHTWTTVASKTFWVPFIHQWKDKIRFWQVGLANHEKIPGCEHYFFHGGKPDVARKLFAVLPRAQFFIGVNSGPMHVAKAFNIPSFILTQQGSIKSIFENRHHYPYFMKGNHVGGFLYEENQHLETDLLSTEDLLHRAGEFLESHYE